YQFGEAAGPFDAHHAGRPAVAAAIFPADIERHHAGGGNPHARGPLLHALTHRIHHAGAINAWDEREDRPAGALVARTQAHVEDAIDSRGMHANSNLALAGLGVRHIVVTESLRRTETADHDRLHACPSGE